MGHPKGRRRQREESGWAARRSQVRATSSQLHAPRFTLHVICEGKTEQRYLSDLMRANPQLNDNVNLIFKGCRERSYTDLKSLIRIAERVERDAIRSTPQAVWIVCDRDQNDDSAREAALSWLRHGKNDCRRGIALSNPCIEEWFLLHVTEGLPLLQDAHAYEKRLVGFLPNYQKGDSRPMPTELTAWAYTQHAVKRERKNLKALAGDRKYSEQSEDLVPLVWQNQNHSTFPEFFEMLVTKVNHRTGKNTLQL